MGLSHFAIGLAYRLGFTGLPVLVLTLCAIACYAMSRAGNVVCDLQIFPNRIRGVAISISVSALWIASFLLTYTFPMIHQSCSGPADTFWLYAGVCFLGFYFILMRVPETKGKTLEQIERELAA